MTSSTDLMCKHCDHHDICKNADTYKKVIEAVRSVSIRNGEKSTIHITNIDWLKDVDPKCKHYQRRFYEYR